MLETIRKVVFMGWFAAITVVLVVYAELTGAPLHQLSQGDLSMNITDLLALLLSLGGFGGFIAFLVNALKAFNIVKEETTTYWITGFNLLGLVVLFALGIFKPDMIAPADKLLAALAQVGMIVLGLLFPNAISRATHALFRGVPLVGTSFSLNRQRAAALAARAAQIKVGVAPGAAKK